MPTFAYCARDGSGRRVTGTLEAESRVALADRLRKMGYLVTRMEESARPLNGSASFKFGPSVSQEGLLLAAVQLANLVESGVPLVSSLQTVASQTTHPVLKEALETATRQIETGSTFSQALGAHPKIFPKLMISMAAVGEASGKLDTTLSRFAGFVEKDLALSRSVKGALTYPAFLLVTSLILIVFVVTFVVPQFASLFVKAGIALPGPTQFLYALGQGIKTRWWVWIGLFAAGAVGLQMAAQAPAVRMYMDRILLKLPIMGTVIHQALVARFSRTLGTLVGAGVPILSALETAQGVAGNRVMVEEVRRVRLAVERGERMAATLSTGKVFYPDAIQMIRVGEEAGRLDVMLEKIADFYELRVNHSLKQMTTLLEPVMLVIMGMVVAFIMASLLLPMFDMVKLLQRGGIR